MEWASQLGLLVFLIASGTVGGRLLWRGWHGGGIHERLLGVTYFLGGPLGYVPLILVVSGATPDDWTRSLRAFGHLNLEFSAMALYAFDRIVFRPHSRALSRFTTAASVGLCATWLGLVLLDGLQGRTLTGSIPYWCDFSLRAGSYLWATVESLQHYVGARRRLALGLVDPVVVDRFLLWGIAMAAITGMFVSSAIAAIASHGGPPAVWYAVDGGLAVIASGAMWVTFFPSRRYLAWLVTRTATQRP